MINLPELKESEKKEFVRIANKLLSSCFVCHKNERQEYRFIEKYRQVFSDYFELAGYRLEENKEYGVFQLVNFQGHNRKQFNLNESIILLILRIIYDEKKRQLSLVKDVVTNIGEIQDYYQAVRGNKKITKTDLRNALSTMRRFHIVDYASLNFKGSYMMSEDETPIIILDSVTMAVPMQNIREVHDQLEKYKTNSSKEVPKHDFIEKLEVDKLASIH